MQIAKFTAELQGQPVSPLMQESAGGRAGEAPKAEILHALRSAEANEQALQRRLHRVHDPRGLELLRGLRERIDALTEQLKTEQM